MVFGDGFTEVDRKRLSGNSELLGRIEERQIAMDRANAVWHIDRKEACEAINTKVNRVSDKIVKLEVNVAKRGFFTGIRGTIALIGSIVAAVAALIVATVKH